MTTLQKIAAYCAANIEDWDLKVDLALRHIGRKMPIDAGFASEIEDRTYEWCDENNVSVEYNQTIDVEEIILAEYE